MTLPQRAFTELIKSNPKSAMAAYACVLEAVYELPGTLFSG